MAEVAETPTRLHSSPMRRTFLFSLLSLLLLAMQHEGYVHALAHAAAPMARGHDASLVAPAADGGCAECALLAGGANAVPGSGAVSAAVVPAIARSGLAFRSHATPAPVYFSSRAPPVLL
jgi:hypothetical protein